MAAFDAFAIADTAADTAVSHTTEADRTLAGSPVFQQGDWSGEWTSPDLTIPNTAHILAGYSDLLQFSSTQRSNSMCQFEINGTKQGINGATQDGHVRSSGTEQGARSGVFLGSLTATDTLTIREGTLLNNSVRTGQYDRISGDPRGLWAIELPTADHIYCSLNANHVAGGRYGNTPRPIDLGTPSAASEGAFVSITNLTTDESAGSTITRSGGTFTIAANKMVLCVATFQHVSQGADRNVFMVRMDVDDSPHCWVGNFTRGSTAFRAPASLIVIPVITGGSSVTVKFSFIENVEETVPELDLDDAFIGFYDLTGSDIIMLDKTDADVTSITTTPQDISYPVADEIQVDSASFIHPVGNLTRIENNAGETITVLAGYYALMDRTTTTTTRKSIMTQMKKSGTLIDYLISGAYNRGQQGSDGTFATGSPYCGAVELTSGQYLELEIRDIASSVAADTAVNCTDGAATKFWAIRLAAAAGAVDTPGVLAVSTRRRALSRILTM